MSSKTTYIAIVALVACIALGGCKTRQKVTIVERVTHDTIYQTRTQHDSIYLRDSVFVDRYTSGDTCYIDRWKWQTKYVEHLRVDTLIEHVCDTVPVPYEVEVYVEKPLRWWQRSLMWLGVALLVYGVVRLALFVRKLFM
jgi:hypothetical protein